MAKKYERGAHVPSWAEVILGAVLSAVLGVLLGAALLVFKPAETVKELPKQEDRKRGVVYYVEGATGGNARQADAKRKAFVAGQTVTVTEAELNALASAAAGPATPPPPAKAPDKKGDKKGAEKGKADDSAAPAAEGFITPGTPNFRIRDGVVQIGAPVTVSVFGMGQKVTMQARGGFKKDGDVFVYDPSELYLGSLPLQRLPFAAGFVRGKVFDSQKVPEDIVTAWRKLSSVTVEGNTLKLAQ
jgi:hypothetical protein